MSGESEHPFCPFCPLQKKTKWYLKTKDNIIVCRDLHNRGYKMRLLVVGSGKRWHRPAYLYEARDRVKIVHLGVKVATNLIKKGEANNIANIDSEHLTYPDHWHIQVCLA